MPSPADAFAAALAEFPSPLQAGLASTLAQGGVIPSAVAAEWLATLAIDIETLMIRLLPVAAAYAEIPISSFPVGAVALGMPPASPGAGPGNLYLGSNMEFRGQALSACVHAEQSATNHAWLRGETGLQALASNAAPCGYCRQFLHELTTAGEGFRILLGADGATVPGGRTCTAHPLGYFLPDAFGPQDLGVQGGLMKPESHRLAIPQDGALAQAALCAANSSYAPYTRNYSGVALECADGRIHAGRYAENAAYNPSMSPLQSALALLHMSLLPGTPHEIVAAALVETAGPVSQKNATRSVLESVAGAVTLDYFQAEAA